MAMAGTRRRPGEVRDAIKDFLRDQMQGAKVSEIQAAVEKALGGEVPRSSVRSYLNLNEGTEFERVEHGRYKVKRGA